MEYVDVVCEKDRCRRVKRFHRHNVLGMLQMVGIKHAAEVSDTVFARLRALRPQPDAAASTSSVPAELMSSAGSSTLGCLNGSSLSINSRKSSSINDTSSRCSLSSGLIAPMIDYSDFENIVACAIDESMSQNESTGHAEHQSMAIAHVRCFRTAFKLRDRSRNIILLLGGTSGCGKSTLASLAGSRLSISTVLSTDNIRHVLRHFYPKSALPVLWTSSYYAGNAIQPDSKASLDDNNPPNEAGAENTANQNNTHNVIEGYEAQNACVFEKIEEIVARFAERKESLVLEGVHLSTKNIMTLVRKYPCCIPFVIYISNKSKHAERFAVRARYMTLEPRENKYIKYFSNIRKIQSYLVEGARAALIPTVNNTNVDRSLSALHRTVLNVLTRTDESSESLYNEETGTLPILKEEYDQVCAQGRGSKAMLEQIITRSEADKCTTEGQQTENSIAERFFGPNSLSQLQLSYLSSRSKKALEHERRLSRCRQISACEEWECADKSESELSETSIADMNEDALRIGSLGS